MKKRVTTSLLAAPLLAAALLLASQADARACEGCKSSMSENTAAQDAGKGFAASIYFMLSMPMLLIGGIGYMAWKNCSQAGVTMVPEGSNENDVAAMAAQRPEVSVVAKPVHA